MISILINSYFFLIISMLKNVYNINFYYFYMNLIVIYHPILHYVGHKITWIIYLYKYTVSSKLWNKIDSLYNIFDIFDIIQRLKKIIKHIHSSLNGEIAK